MVTAVETVLGQQVAADKVTKRFSSTGKCAHSEPFLSQHRTARDCASHSTMTRCPYLCSRRHHGRGERCGEQRR